MVFFKKFKNSRFLKNYYFLLKPVAIMSAVYMIAFLAIIRANFNYNDDLGRVAFGYKDFLGFSRQTSEYLSGVIHTNNFLADISPLTTLLSSIILGLASVFAIFIITKNKKFSFINYILATLIGLSPYFLENISYKFDSPYMSLSILAAIFPFLFFYTKRAFYIISLLCTIIICTSYQAGIGIYISLLLVLIFRDLLEKEIRFKDILLFGIKGIVPFLLGLIFFKFFMMKPTNANEYVSNSLPGIFEIIPTFFKNLSNFYSYYFSNYRIVWTLLSVLLLVLSGASITTSKKSELTKAVGLMCYCALLLMVSLAAFGLYPFLTRPLILPRTMYGLPTSIAFVFVLGVTFVDREFFVWLYHIIGGALAYCYIVFAFIYGNILYNQNFYANYRIEDIITTLNIENILTETTERVAIDGEIGFAPASRNTMQTFPILKKLVPKNLCGSSWMWCQYKFFYYYNISPSLWVNKNDLHELNKTFESYLYTIKYSDRDILITIKDR